MKVFAGQEGFTAECAENAERKNGLNKTNRLVEYSVQPMKLG
jgi:hypothetical protein